jgi:LysM repeat protein
LNVNQRPKNIFRLKRYLAGVVLIAASLACSLSPRAAEAPYFTPPGGVNTPTNPPEPSILPVEFDPVTDTPDVIEERTSPNLTTQIAEPTVTPTETPPAINSTPLLYYTQAGDTLPVVAVRYGVQPEEITSPDPFPETALLNPKQLLIIPNRLANTTSGQHLIPDSEVVYSPSALDFDVSSFVQEAGGFLSEYEQFLMSTGMTSGAEVVERVAIENSINPRLLLALLEYQSNWVYGKPSDAKNDEYPLGYKDPLEKGLYKQLAWALNQLSIGYYGWREGRLTEIEFSDGVTARLAPDLNAGTAALQYYFAQFYDSQGWLEALDPVNGFPAFYEKMFGSPWVRALEVEPLYPPELAQPNLILPFTVDQIWGFTGGPHGAWERDGAWAAIDFAPGSLKSGCVDTDVYTVASAPALVVRSDHGVVSLDLDGDGREQTGWVLIYLHIAKKGRIPAGTWVEAGDFIGHASCEGGFSTGTHIHMARKYNGEWIVADGPLPFVLSGWRVRAGEKPYQGSLTRGDQIIPASPVSPFASRIIRRSNDP